MSMYAATNILTIYLLKMQNIIKKWYTLLYTKGYIAITIKIMIFETLQKYEIVWSNWLI